MILLGVNCDDLVTEEDAPTEQLTDSPQENQDTPGHTGAAGALDDLGEASPTSTISLQVKCFICREVKC